jgi:hypothetical protein
MIETGHQKVYRMGSQAMEALRAYHDHRPGRVVSVMAPRVRKSNLMNILGCLDSPSEGNICSRTRCRGHVDQLACPQQDDRLFSRATSCPTPRPGKRQLPLLFNGKKKARRDRAGAPGRGRPPRMEGSLAFGLSGGAAAHELARALADPPFSADSHREPRLAERRGDHDAPRPPLAGGPDHHHGHPRRPDRRALGAHHPALRRSAGLSPGATASLPLRDRRSPIPPRWWRRAQPSGIPARIAPGGTPKPSPIVL